MGQLQRQWKALWSSSRGVLDTMLQGCSRVHHSVRREGLAPGLAVCECSDMWKGGQSQGVSDKRGGCCRS